MKVISRIIYVSNMTCNGKMFCVTMMICIKCCITVFLRWSRVGIFNNIFAELAKTAGKDVRLMIDAHLKPIILQQACLKKGLFSAVSDAQRAV